MLDRKYGDGEFMTIAATDAAAWWNTLNCEMMNAAIPDDADPAPPMDHTSMDSPYCMMYAGLEEDAMMVVRQAFMDSGYATITGTSHMDMGPDGNDHVHVPGQGGERCRREHGV